MSIDPKKKRFEAYEFSRQSGDITYSNEEMEAKLSSEEGRKAFHTYLTGKYENMGSFEDWEAAFFPEYSKKKDSGELAAGSAASSSAIESTPLAPTEGEPAKPMDAKALLESQGVGFAPVRQAIEAPEKVEPSYLDEMGMAQMAPESTAAPTVLQSAQFNDIILERQQDYIKALSTVPNEALSDPTTAFGLLNINDDAKSLHDDPDTPDRIKGQIKASVINDAANLVSERLTLMEASLGEDLIDRYSDAKAALIEIYESGDPEMQVGGRGMQQWLDDYEMLLQSEPALAEYDTLVEKSYALNQSYKNIANVNPEYTKDLEAKRTKQIMADVMFNVATPVGMEQPSIAIRAAAGEAFGWVQGITSFVGSVGNSYGNSSGRWDWADKTADFAMQKMVPPMWLMEPSRAQRSIFTMTANVGDYQVDVDSDGNPTAVRDKNGDIVFNEQTRAQVIDQYESMPDKYDVRYKPHLAPAISTAAHGTVQVLVTSRFAGLGRTAAAAKGISAGVLTARFAGQNYMQALEEFGPQNARTAAQFAIGTAALQSAISIYVNPLEIKLNPKFNVSPKTLKRVARDLDAGKSADVAMRNGFRGYTDDLAKTLLTYGKEIGREGIEGLMEKAVDIGGRQIVRSATDIRAEYDASAMAWVDAFTSEMVGAMGAAGLSVGARNMWQQEGLMIAYENKDRILPMVKQMHGEEAATKLSAALKAADKRIAGKKLDRNQKNAIVVEEYNKAIKAYEEEAETAPPAEATPVVQEEVQPQPAQAAPAPEPEVSRVEPQADVYQVLREESKVLLLEPGTKFYTDGGIEFTVENADGDSITARNGDTDQITTKSKREIQEAIRQQTRDRLSREFPGFDDRRINGIRRALADVAMQRKPIETEETTATPVAPALPPAQEAPAATTATPTTVEPVVPTGAKVYTRQNIQQAEGIDGAEMGRLMDVVAEISPDMQVQVFENNADMQAAVGQSGNAFVSEDGRTIYISKESASIDKIHEVMHPIVVAADMRSPGTIERFYGEIFSTMPENVRNDIEAFIAQAGYAQMEAPARQEEAVVEFLARLADGRYDESILRDQTFVGKIINFFSDIFQKLGIVNPPSDVESLKTFAAKVVKAVKSGSTISFDSGVTQPAATATQPEVTVEKEPPYRSEEEYLQWVADNSNDPIEISEAYISSHKLDQDDARMQAKDRIILDEKLHEMSEKDFGSYLDPNWIDRAVRNKFIRPIANDLDDRVESVSERYGIEITIDDVVDFVGRDIRGEVDRRKAGETSAMTKALGARYGEVTGGRMTIQTARKNVREALKQIDKEYEKHLVEQGQSQAELEEAYYQAIRDGRIPAPAEVGARGGAVEGISPGAEGRVKPRITDDTLDPVYHRAKKWMREEMDQIPPPGVPPRTKADIVADAVGTYGITPGQAETMYDVLFNAPESKRMSMQSGVPIKRRGFAGALGKLAQFKNEWLLKSKGMPIEVLQGLEMALGSTERMVRRTMQSYTRLMKMIDKMPKDKRDEALALANQFIDGRIKVEDVEKLPEDIYSELLQIRSWIDEVSTEILNDSAFSEMRTEIISSNFGEYVSRVYRVHLMSNYSPAKAAVKKYYDEYRRRNYDRIADANRGKTQEELEVIIKDSAERSMNRILNKYKADIGGIGKNKAKKPTGIMSERKQLPGRAADLWEAIDNMQWGPMTLPPAAGPVSGTGNPEFEAMFNAAWEDLRKDRIRESYYTHPQLSAEYKRLERQGEKLVRLGTGIGVIAPGSNPFTTDNIRKAVENRTLFNYVTLPPNTSPADAKKFFDTLNDINDSIVDISNRVLDRVNADMDAIMANRDEIDGSDGFRSITHLSPGVRAILGEVSPLDATIITMSKMAHYYNLNKYYRRIRAIGEGEFLFRADDDTAPAWASHKIAGRDIEVDQIPPDKTTEALAPLSGMYSSREIVEMLTNVSEFADMSFDATLSLYTKLNGMVQYGKTILSPATQSKNFLSNLWFVMRNMWASPAHMAFAFLYVPADHMMRLITHGQRISASDTGLLAPLKQMSDAMGAAFFDNFGNPPWFSKWDAGTDVPFKMNMQDFGFDPANSNDISAFNAAKADISAGMKRQESRKMIVTDVVNQYGISEDNAYKMYAALQSKSFRDEMSGLVNKLGSYGLLGASVSLKTIMANLDQISTKKKAAAFVTNSILYDDANKTHRAWAQTKGKVRGFFETLEGLYSFGDDVFKIFGYLRERASYSDILYSKPYHLLTDEQQAEVDAKAIEVVKNTIPNYDRIGRLGQVISKNLFIGNFIAFKMESLRVWANQLSLGMKEVQDGRATGNNKMVVNGGKRMAGNLVMMGAGKALEASIIAAASKQVPEAFQFIGDMLSGLFDDDEEDEVKRMVRDYMLPWAENDYLVISSVDKEAGKITAYSISANHPFGDIQRASIVLETGLSDADPAAQIAVMMFLELFGQLGDAKIFTKAIVNVVGGKDQYGRDIFNKSTEDYEGDSPDVIMSKVLIYLLKQAGPGVISQASRAGLLDFLPENEWFGSFRKPPHAGERSDELIAMFSGFRPMVIDVYDAFERRARDYFTLYGKSGVQGTIYKAVKPWDTNIDNATFEQRIRDMVASEYNTLKSLREAYYLPIKHDVVDGQKMREIVTKEVGVSLKNNKQGRNARAIVYGEYRTPNEVINKHIEVRRESFPDYNPSEDLLKWLKDFQAEKKLELGALK